MKLKLLLCLALVLSGGFSVAHADGTNAPVTTSANPKDITAKLVVPGSSGLFGAKCKIESVAAKEFNHKIKAGALSGADFLFAAIHDPYTKMIYIVPSSPETNYFYISDKSGMIWCGLLEGGGFVCSKSPFEMPESAGGINVEIGRFESEYDDLKLEEGKDANMFRIGLRTAVPALFFTTHSGSSQPARGTIQAIDMADGILHLNILSDGGKYVASLWIDLKAKKVIKSIVNDQEMDLTGKAFAVPLKKK